MAGVELWGTARGEHARVVRELGGNPIDYQREDFTRVLPSGFDIVFDGVGQDSYRRSYAALKPGGLLVAYGYSASVQPQRRLPSLLTSLAARVPVAWIAALVTRGQAHLRLLDQPHAGAAS